MKKFLLLIALIISGMGLFAQDAASATKVTDDDYFWLEEVNITQTSASFIIKSIDDDFYYNHDFVKWMIEAYENSDKRTVFATWGCLPIKEKGQYLPYSPIIELPFFL